MSDKITMGSVWWTIRPSVESAAYGKRGDCLPWSVKAHSYEEYGTWQGSWALSAFNAETGEVDDDPNCTVYAFDRDVGKTFFEDEADAWSAYFGGPNGPVETFFRAAADLRDAGRQIRRTLPERGEAVRAVISRHLDEIGRLVARIDAGGLLGEDR